MDSSGFQWDHWITLGSHSDHTRITLGLHWIPLDPTGFHWKIVDYTGITLGLHWIPLDTTGSHWKEVDPTYWKEVDHTGRKWITLDHTER